VKNIQDLIAHIRTAIGAIYEQPEANAMAMQVAEHVLHLSRLQLSLEQQTPVSAETQTIVDEIISRLQKHEPLQYVLGYAHFFGLELAVTPAVLIPRPETEELVELIIRENYNRPALQLLDIGTGSGCIAIALAAHLNPQQVFALDVSEEALAVARRNARKYQQDINWLHHDILHDSLPLPPGSLDIIVSNPPYVLQQEIQYMRPNVVSYEPHLALFVPDQDALRFYRRIAQASLTLLNKTGKLYFEINEKQALPLMTLLQEMGYQQVNVRQDIFGKDRFVQAALK
jgi:release factor glutamine methyltransferase